MSARIPDWLDSHTLRWLADRATRSSDEWHDTANARQAALNLGDEISYPTADHDSAVDRCRLIARRERAEARWMRAAATRVERRRAKGGAR